MNSRTLLPERHQRVMLDASDPIHRACDFFVQSSENKALNFAAVNKWLHSREVASPWPEFLVAFASNGCGDYFAYDMSQSPAPIIYIDPDRTPEENLGDPEALRYVSFDDWYESEVEQLKCKRCGSIDTRLHASPDRKWLLRVCSNCEFQDQAIVIDP